MSKACSVGTNGGWKLAKLCPRRTRVRVRGAEIEFGRAATNRAAVGRPASKVHKVHSHTRTRARSGRGVEDGRRRMFANLRSDGKVRSGREASRAHRRA